MRAARNGRRRKLARSRRNSVATRSKLIGPEHWPTLQKHGLICAIASNGMPGAPFMRGFNNPAFHDEVIERTSKTIDQCADAKFPSVIAFVGYKWTNPDDPKSGDDHATTTPSPTA